MPEPVNLRIEYLVRRRFPNVNMLLVMPSLSRRTPAPDTTKLREAVAAYRAELAALTLDEVAARHDDEQAKEHEEMQQKLGREERERFFNQPSANADFDHWSKAAHWTLDEAIALSFGRAPEIVRWDKLKPYESLNWPFVLQYARRRDLALRAVAWNQLFDPVLPGIFLAWAKRTDIAVPPELIQAIEKRGVQVADWKSLYDQVAEARKRDSDAYESMIADWTRMHSELSVQIKRDHSEWLRITDDKDRQIAALEERIASLEPPQSRQPDSEIGTRSRESLLKMVIGMAVAGYAYDPKVARSDKPREIAGDLEGAGVPLDVDTVRKWLREAAELLPPK